MSNMFFVASGVVYVLLGVMHACLTLQTVRRPQYVEAFSPTGPTTRAQMESSGVGIHPSANLWNAWIGFNFSHSLGAVIFGGVLIGGAQSSDFVNRHHLAATLVLVCALAYVALAKLFWFRNPLIGTTLAACLVFAGTVWTLPATASNS